MKRYIGHKIIQQEYDIHLPSLHLHACVDHIFIPHDLTIADIQPAFTVPISYVSSPKIINRLTYLLAYDVTFVDGRTFELSGSFDVPNNRIRWRIGQDVLDHFATVTHVRNLHFSQFFTNIPFDIPEKYSDWNMSLLYEPTIEWGGHGATDSECHCGEYTSYDFLTEESVSIQLSDRRPLEWRADDPPYWLDHQSFQADAVDRVHIREDRSVVYHLRSNNNPFKVIFDTPAVHVDDSCDIPQ